MAVVCWWRRGGLGLGRGEGSGRAVVERKGLGGASESSVRGGVDDGLC